MEKMKETLAQDDTPPAQTENLSENLASAEEESSEEESSENPPPPPYNFTALIADLGDDLMGILARNPPRPENEDVFPLYEESDEGSHDEEIWRKIDQENRTAEVKDNTHLGPSLYPLKTPLASLVLIENQQKALYNPSVVQGVSELILTNFTSSATG